MRVKLDIGLNMKFLEQFYKISKDFESLLPKDSEVNEIFEKIQMDYSSQDPWGLDLKFCRRAVKFLTPLYRNYFQVRTFGMENIDPDETYVMVSNHGGQIAIDGMLIGLSMVLDSDKPRIIRPMIERFMTELPFVAQTSYKGGAVLGDRTNCIEVLKRNQTVLVFPEGVRGVAKSTSQFYELQSFSKGFYRIALAERKKIVPIAVIGAEEIYPFVYQAKGLAKMLGLPALPVTPFFPWLGLLGAMPLPSPIDIYVGKPIPLPEISEDAPDKEINPHVFSIQETIQSMIHHGLKNRRNFIRPKETVKDALKTINDLGKKFKI